MTDKQFARFIAGIDPSAVRGCWTRPVSLMRNGYGRFGTRLAHRVSYEHFVGPIPEGLDIDHLCRNRACVNPTHLEPVTRAVNVQRGIGPQLASERGKGNTWNEGRLLTPEIKAKISAAIRGRTLTPAWRAKIGAAQLGHRCSPETKAKMAAARHAYWQRKREQVA
jgi:hypothetical protein